PPPPALVPTPELHGRRGPDARGEPREPNVDPGEQPAGGREWRSDPEDGGQGPPVRRVEADKAAPERDADPDQEAPTPHHHRGESGALHAEPRKRADAGDH